MALPLLVQTNCRPADPSETNSQPKLILEVMNWHFTVGRKFPSVYLRVFSDGSVECHTLQYDGTQKDEVRKAVLTPEQLAQLQRLISESNLQSVRPRYELTTQVFDSWMEWDINIPRSTHVQHIEVAHRSAGFPMMTEEAYPFPLLGLGCSIWKLRNDAFADAPPYTGCEKYSSVR